MTSIEEIAKQKDLERSQVKSKEQQLAEWRSKQNDLRHLMERDLDNLPSEMDIRVMDFMLHVFKK